MGNYRNVQILSHYLVDDGLDFKKLLSVAFVKYIKKYILHPFLTI